MTPATHHNSPHLHPAGEVDLVARAAIPLLVADVLEPVEVRVAARFNSTATRPKLPRWLKRRVQAHFPAARVVKSLCHRQGSAGQHSFECFVERLISAGDVEQTMRGALVVQEASQ